MRNLKRMFASSLLLALVNFSYGCGGTDADALGVAAECSSDSDCAIVSVDGEEVQLTCLKQFDGGYCAIEDCENNLDCPEGASCVSHDDGSNYCFRKCRDKAECNANRSVDNAANCSANFDYADQSDALDGVKACLPPSSGNGKK